MTPQSPSQFGVCSWSLRPTSPANLADSVKQIGVKKVQLALTAHREDPGAVRGVAEELAKVGAKVVSGMFGTVGEDYSTPQTIAATGGVVPDQHWKENLEIAKASAKAAKAMGLKLVSMHAGFLPEDHHAPAFIKLRDRIVTLGKVFADLGLDLLFETGQETAKALWLFLEELDSHKATNCHVNFDPANMILYEKGDPIDSLRKLLPRVKAIHIKDAIQTKVPGTWGEEVPVGEGQVDWKAFLGTLAGGDYQGDLIIEREAGESRIADVRKAVERLSKLMK